MVLTRRAAKAAAEATVAAPTVEPDAASQPGSSFKPSEPSYDPDDITLQKHHQDTLRRSISLRLAIGHFCAFVAVVTVAHGAGYPVHKLELHALILLLCTIPLRTILSFTAHSVRQPLQRSGIFLALNAPVVFSSHALHVLATRASPHRIRRLMACAAVDICANWLKMAVSAKTPTTEPFAIPVSLIYSAADIFLAAVISRHQSIVGFFYPFLALRFLYNIGVVVTCSVSIVQQEEANKQVADAPR